MQDNIFPVGFCPETRVGKGQIVGVGVGMGVEVGEGVAVAGGKFKPPVPGVGVVAG